MWTLRTLAPNWCLEILVHLGDDVTKSIAPQIFQPARNQGTKPIQKIGHLLFGWLLKSGSFSENGDLISDIVNGLGFRHIGSTGFQEDVL